MCISMVQRLYRPGIEKLISFDLQGFLLVMESESQQGETRQAFWVRHSGELVQLVKHL
jgi:hypothetical protein